MPIRLAPIAIPISMVGASRTLSSEDASSPLANLTGSTPRQRFPRSHAGSAADVDAAVRCLRAESQHHRHAHEQATRRLNDVVSVEALMNNGRASVDVVVFQGMP